MDELLGKKVPFSAQAEQAVIGSVLIDPDCIPSVMECLRADEFYGKLNRDIYDTVYSMFAYGMTVDPFWCVPVFSDPGSHEESPACSELLPPKEPDRDQEY